MRRGSAALVRPLRDALGRRAYLMIDRMVKARLQQQWAAQEEALITAVKSRVQYDALREPLVFGPSERLRISPSAQVNDALFNTISGNIDVEGEAFFGHGVALLTGTHDIEVRGAARRDAIPACGRDIRIGAGAWISSRALILGPCRIGADAVVAAGAVVTKDVPPGAVVAGAPAHIVRRLSFPHALPPAIDVKTDVGRMFAHADDQVVTPALRAGGHGGEPEIQELRRLLQPGMSVLDVGANIGYVTLLCASAVGPTGHVIAVEPHPSNLRLLRANIARHGLENVRVVAGAALDHANEVVLSECDTNTGDHRIGALVDVRSAVQVRGIVLDELLGAPARVDVIKLDTQASEHVALAGARELIQRCAPILLVEFWPQGIRQRGDEPLQVLQQYRALDPALRVMEDSTLEALSDEKLIAGVDERPGTHGGFVTLVLRA